MHLSKNDEEKNKNRQPWSWVMVWFVLSPWNQRMVWLVVWKFWTQAVNLIQWSKETLRTCLQRWEIPSTWMLPFAEDWASANSAPTIVYLIWDLGNRGQGYRPSCPLPKGGKVGLFRWCRSWVKPSVQIDSIAKNGGISVFTVVETYSWRGNDGNEKSGVIEKTAMVFGRMNEPPGARTRAYWLDVAEYFRDVGQDVCSLFIDNIFRSQAGSEVSALWVSWLPTNPCYGNGQLQNVSHQRRDL